MYYIYILYSETSDKYYIGYSNDYYARVKQHNTSERNTYTSKHRPWKLAAVFECGKDRGIAIRIERFIKRQKSRKLIEKIISSEKLGGELAQLVRVPHVRD